MSGSKIRLKDYLPEASTKNHLTSALSRTRISKGDLTLNGTPLRIVQGVCAFLSFLSLIVCIISIPLTLTYYDPLCSTLNGPCSGQLTSAELQSLSSIGLSQQGYTNFLVGDLILQYLLSLALAFLLFWRKPNHIYSLLWATSWLMMASFPFTAAFVNLGPVEWHLPMLVFSSLGFWLVWLGFYLFPNMRFAPVWSWFGLAFYVVFHIIYNIASGGKFSGGLGDFWLTQLAFIVLLSGGLVSQTYRYFWVSDQLQRQQTKWVLYGLGLLFFFGLLVSLLPTLLPNFTQPGSLYNLFMVSVFSLIPYFIGGGVVIGILRYRLWDIDLIISRTLVFVLLTGCVVGLYALIVLGANRLFGLGTNNLAVSLLATGLIAVLFQPLRTGLQRTVNRLLFGRRDEPYSVLSGLGQRLETMNYRPEAVLPELVDSIANALKLPFVAIKLIGQEKVVAEAAMSTNGLSSPVSTPVSLALSYQGETVGELLVSPRRGEERLAGRDLQLLKDLARQIGVVVYSLKLLEDLRQSNTELTTSNLDLRRAREKLVLAREEERRKLRRDLHDDLAPSLAGLALSADALTGLIEQNPAEARIKSQELYTSIRRSVGDIRRLAHELRPPTLDEFGLVAALQERTQQFSAGNMLVTLEAPANLPHLPAAVEVATYRVAQEALMNVVRHAAARHCLIRLLYSQEKSKQVSKNEAKLTLEISDDGQGLPANRNGLQGGVGLRSMREQSEELGGIFTIENGASGGTLVRMVLPFEGSKHNESASRNDS